MLKLPYLALAPCVAALLAGVAPAPLAASAPPTATQDDVESAMRAHLDRAGVERGLAGYTAIIALGGEPLVARAWGEHVDGEELEVDSRFRVPALLRPLTSIAVLRLVQAGQVKLEDPIGKHVEFPLDAQPDWCNGDDLDKVVTVVELLGGTSGLIGWDGVLTRDQREVATRDELLRVVALQGLATQPGHCFEPNESELLLLGALVEARTGAPLDSALTALLAKAGVEGGGFVEADDTPAIVEASAGFELDGDLVDAPAALFPFGEDRLAFSAPELALIVRAMADREVLDESTLGELLQERRIHTGPLTGFGLGVDLVQLDELQGIVAGGAALGQAVHVARYTEPDLTVVLLGAVPRALDDARLAVLGQELARMALGLPAPGVQDLELGEREAGMYVGAYMLGCDRLEVRRGDDGHLVLDRVDRAPVVLLYQGGRRFLAKLDPGAAFEFVMDLEEPLARTLVLFEHGLRSEAVRVE